MQESLRQLVAGTVDYAGLFPPASLGMWDAARAYADYLRDPARFQLARFVVPVARLREFDEAAADLLPHGGDGEPWRLTALVGPDVSADVDLALKFNCRHWSESPDGHALIDALELKATTAPEVRSAMSTMPGQFTAYFEIPLDADAALFSAIARAGARVKGRTGGVSREAFPSADSIASFILRARDAGVPFKLTAGLHHPVNGEYRLTYADDAPRGAMLGFVNVLVASTLAAARAPDDLVRDAIVEPSASAFNFMRDAFTYREFTVPLDAIRAARTGAMISFGSCSFREPADELAALHLD